MRVRSQQRGRQVAGGTRALDRRVAPLLEAHRLGHDLRQAAVEIAAEYARDGESLDTFLHDFGGCLSVAGLLPPDTAMLRSTSIAWADAYLDRYNRITCVHESGLHSVHHLQSHVRAVLTGDPSPTPRASVRRSTAYVLLVVELPAELATQANVALLSDELLAQTPPGTVLASLSSRRSAALLRRTPATSELAGRLDRTLSVRLAVTGDGLRLRSWIEGLPHDVDAASRLVAELTR